MPPKKHTDADREVIRDWYVKHAKQLVVERGIAWSVDDLAKACQSAVGRVYLYFKSKEALLAACLADDMARGIPWATAVQRYIPRGLAQPEVQ